MLILFLSFAGMTAETEDVQAAKKVLPKKINVKGGASAQSGLKIQTGKKKKINYTVTPKKATNKKVTFSSSDKKVAKVTAKGTIEGVGKGTATITIKSKAKKTVRSKIRVTVEETPVLRAAGVNAYQAPAVNFAPVGSERAEGILDTYLAAGNTATGITLNQTYLELAPGESFQMSASVVPVTSTDKVVWSINFVGGINISSTGNIFVTDDTPVGTTAIVTAKCGRATAQCQVVTVQGPCVHEWGPWAVTTEPQCMVEGVERSTCSKCGKIRERAVAATGHQFLDRTPNLKDPTCTEAGEKEKECQKCGEVRTEIIPATGHSLSPNGTILEEATCTKPGKIQYTCTICGEEIEDTYAAKGHTWDNGEITKSPTCTGTGQRTYHCTVPECTGTKTESIPATNHIWTYGEITVQPTCTTGGRRICTCLVCSAKTTATVEKLGHTWDTDNPKIEPATCTKREVKTFTCKTCQATKNEYGPALGHDLPIERNADGTPKLDADGNEIPVYTIDEPATCFQKGKKSRHCTRCSYVTDIKSIPKEPHKMAVETNADGSPKLDADGNEIPYYERYDAPTCTLPGIRVRACVQEGCTYKKHEMLEALGHDWPMEKEADGSPKLDDKGKEILIYETIEEPTCINSGKKAVVCKRCGKMKNIKFIDPLGHQWDDANAIVTEATCTTEGSRTVTCIREVTDPDNPNGPKKKCGIRKTDIIPALKHKFSDTWTKDKEPTCTEAGQESRHCTNTYKDETGKTVTCDVVDDIRVIEPKGHNWTTWAQKVAPAHGVPGSEERRCTTCGMTQTRGKTEEHSYNANGVCLKCGKSFSMENTVSSDWEYQVNDTEKTVLLKKYIGTKACIRIPASMSVTVDGVIGTYAVKFAGGYAPATKSGVFASNKKCKIKAVSFEDGVKIESMKYMFYGCDELEAVLSIPSSVKDLTAAFKDCTSLMYVAKLPSAIEELSNTFENCTKLSVAPAIPANVTSLYATFKNCELLTSAPVLPPRLEDFNWTFSGCKGISEAPKIPATVTEMTNTFESCTSLLNVPEDIPSGVKKLTMTFYGCNGLEMVPEMPSTVETMEYTFKNCKNIAYAAELPKTVIRQVDVFAGCDKLK